MSDLVSRLQSALGGAYRVERELGGGGMSRVFVAEEVELGRKVVVKVLPPEMAAGVNADRFSREIKLAASLQHPHIVPLLSAGHTDDLVWYTMPLIEGESLRAKLAREGELPVPEAVRILRDVADALAYAHRHGVVHRDIKPDNVMLSDHHAVVTDFGVAKAISESTGEASLTSIGVALGTPAYMAPEQASADPHVDHRADIYALGALGYEMLTGQPPFTGAPQMVLAAHVTQAPEPVAMRRASVPAALAALIMRCLEKKAADRWQTADELHQQFDAMATPSGGMTPTDAVPATAPSPPRRRRARAAAGAALALVVVVAVVGVVLWRRSAGASPSVVDPNVVAVLPFRVAGADPALHYLREGMMDLLAAKLTGDGGPRAADPRSVASAWRRAASSADDDLPQDEALRLARRLGAGQLLLGGIVGSTGHLVLNASLLGVPDGATRVRATVEGPADRLPSLLDRLVAQLLAGTSGLGERASLTASLEALRAYLVGQAAYRRGDYEEAARQLGRAIHADSTFALAALQLAVTAGWLGGPAGVPDIARVNRIAWAGRERLSARDRALLEAYLGPRFPAPSSQAELLAARERAVEVAPDQPDAWYILGDKYFHEGRHLGIADWADRATAGFRRALALDSTFAGPLSHMVDLAVFRGDTAETRRLGTLFLRSDSASRGYALVVRWLMAEALRDTALLRQAWARLDSVGGAWIVAGIAQATSVGLSDLDQLLEIQARTATTRNEREFGFSVRGITRMNEGRLREAFAAFDSASRLSGRDLDLAENQVQAALYWDADSATGARGAAQLARAADGPPADSAGLSAQQRMACLLEQWRIARGDVARAAHTIARLRGPSTPSDSAAAWPAAGLCASLLDAMLARAQHRPDSRQPLERADSISRTGPPGSALVPHYNLALARAWAALGDPGRALAAVRRGGYYRDDVMISTYRREEGRLADLAGDRDGAVGAYRQYLTMRRNPDPGPAALDAQVRAELARLEGAR